MVKVTVTKKEMLAIEYQRDLHAKNLNSLLNNLINGARYHSESAPINDMTAEKIVLAWHGHVEVEQEYVSFDEAMKARKKGFRVSFHYSVKQVIIGPFKTNILKESMLGYFMLDELLEGKWTIGGSVTNEPN